MKFKDIIFLGVATMALSIIAALLSNSSSAPQTSAPDLSYKYTSLTSPSREVHSVSIGKNRTSSVLEEEGFVPASAPREVQPGLILTPYIEKN